MPSILNLKFKGNKSFVAFSNLGDTDSLTKTWKVCTKVASFLEQGARLENLSWRLWHLQNLMVDSDNAKSKREFKKLSKHMGDKLDKEKGRSIEELEAPDFRRNHSSDMLRQRAEEKERNREASQNAKPGTIKRTHFTFSVEQPAMGAASLEPVQKPDLKPSAQFRDATAAALKRGRPTTRSAATTTAPSSSSSANVDASVDQQQSLFSPSNASHDLNVSAPKPVSNNFDYNSMTSQPQPTSLHFPSIFNDSFGPSALLYPTPTLTNSMNYGEGVGIGIGAASADGFSIARPTIELALDDLLSNADMAESPEPWIMNEPTQQQQLPKQSQAIQTSFDMDVPMPLATVPAMRMDDGENDGDYESNASSSEDEQSAPAPAPPAPAPLPTSTRSTAASRRSAVVKDSIITRSGTSTPVVRPTLTIKTQPSSSSRPGATATNPPASRGGNNSAPGGVKAECSNCGATHTPLWRRGLNDELNCNACGLYCKLHKRPRPKNMRNNHGEGRSQSSNTTTSSVASTSRQEATESISSNNNATSANSNSNTSAPATAQCYNCHTTATPLWRKDDVGKTVCNACGLYFKLHGSARPISMKSDVIRKRSRHDARRMSSSGGPDSPSASPGASRRASPLPETSPVLAPDSTTQMNYDYGTDSDFHSSASELMGALGGEHHQGGLYGSTNSLTSSSSSVGAGNGGNVFNPFPGPYHPDYLTQNYVQHQPPSDALPFASVEAADMQESLTSELGRTAKRRRMSVDSASEPPSSAVSYSSYTDGASSSRSSSMDFNFGFYQANYPVLRSSAAAQAQNAFWHPPMMPQAIMDSPQMFHPPMLPSGGEDSTMDYLHSSATTSSASSSSLLGSGVTGTNGPSNNSNNNNNNKGIGAVHGPGSAPSSVVQDDDSLFATYLHPPMLTHDESTPSAGGSVSFNSPRMPHPPVFASEGMYYENSGMQSY